MWMEKASEFLALFRILVAAMNPQYRIRYRALARIEGIHVRSSQVRIA
jgi:hypothetical protein